MPFVSLVRRPLLSTVLSLMLLGTSALAGAVAVRAAAGELFFSEYIEGSSDAADVLVGETYLFRSQP